MIGIHQIEYRLYNGDPPPSRPFVLRFVLDGLYNIVYRFPINIDLYVARYTYICHKYPV